MDSNGASIEESHPRKLDKGDRAVIKTANELLESLEQSHRNDLALHLYSTYLLKYLLRSANRKNYQLETDVFIKTQIKDNWTSWPNPYTVLDPQTNKVFEDFEDNSSSEELTTGEISPNGLKHASEMMKLELDAVWQRLLSKSAVSSSITLDIDKMNIPDQLSASILTKLDHFFEGLHNKVARHSKVGVQQSTNSTEIKLTEGYTNDSVRMNRKIKLDYRDIITRGCQMKEEMSSIYMKALELYSDIPSRFRKSAFKLDKKELQKYSTVARSQSVNSKSTKRFRQDYVSVKRLIKEKQMTFDCKRQLRSVLNSQRDFSLDKKTFFMVKGFQGENESDDSTITLEDCLVNLNK